MAMKKKPCDFCESDYLFNRTNPFADGPHQLCIEFYPFSGPFAAVSYGADVNGETEELYWNENFNYCPMCGRKLDW